MSLIDKYNIIENHIIDKNKVSIKLENYFENYFESDIKVFIPDYINQIIYFEKANINIDFLGNQIEKLLIQRRNNIRNLIKKDNFELSGLNKFIKLFIKKIEYINNLFNKSNIIRFSIDNLSKLIISDSIIMMFIEQEIITFDDKNYSQIETLINLIKSLNKYDSLILTNFLRLLCNIFNRQLSIDVDIPLSQNLRIINKFYDSIKYYKKIQEYYSFIKLELSELDKDIKDIIIKNFCDVIKNNTLLEVEFVMNNIWLEFNTIIFNNSNINENIINNIIILINKNLNTENLNKIINIITYLNISPDDKHFINQKIINLLTKNNMNESILYNLDLYIRENKENELSSIISIINQLKDKDIFINKNHELLIKRLLENFSKPQPEFNTYIKFESHILDKMNKYFGNNLLYKSRKVIADIVQSYENNKLENCDVITTSYNIWDINQTEGLLSYDIVNENTILGTYMKKYQDYYLSKYEDRIINWLPHFGEVKITYLDQKLKMLPIQFIVVEMFNNTNRILIQDIIDSKVLINYTPKFRNDIIGSLVLSGLFSISNNYLVLSMSGKFKEDLIQVFFNNSDYAIICEEKRNDYLVHTREEITKTNINKILKTNTLSFDELFNTTKNAINVFELDNNIFTKSIDNMINMDYIKLENDKYIRLFY
jgi:hypothetical protein